MIKILRVGNRIIVLTGRDPLTYYDLDTGKTVRYKKLKKVVEK